MAQERALLKFPLEDQDQYQASILFQKFKVKGAGLRQVEQFNNQMNENASDRNFTETLRRGVDLMTFGVLEGTRVAPEQTAGEAAENLSIDSQTGESPPPPNNLEYVIDEGGLSGACSMYLPQSINITDGLKIDAVDLGIFGSVMERSLGSGDTGILGSMSAALGEAASSIGELVGFGEGTEEIFKIAAGRVSAANQSINSAITSAVAMTPNPNTRAIFQGVNLRRFTLAFEMMPKSPQESQMAKNIIKYFRLGAYPESFRTGGISAGYHTPRKFGIKMFHNRNNERLVYNFKKCFLENVTTNFNGQNMAFFDDGNFQRYEIQLQFLEEQTIDQQDVMEGF